MKKKLIIPAAAILFLLLSFGWLSFLEFKDLPAQEKTSEQKIILNKHVKAAKKRYAGTFKPLKPGSTDQSKKGLLLDKPAQKPISHSRDIEDIKKQIYDRNIEYVEQIELLDALVQTGDADTREFWDSDWNSVDDWKKDGNGFQLKKNEDGKLIFSPDEQTARTYTFFENPQAYTYDEENREFVNEVDYYGKTIYNVVKFINDDVLAMMTISGRKVDLNIYQKNADKE